MASYINADAIEYHEIYDGQEFVSVAFKDDIDEMPTVDMVKVVRCKNCTDWQTDWAPYCFEEGAYHYCGTIDTVTNAEDFCSKGEERKELI